MIYLGMVNINALTKTVTNDYVRSTGTENINVLTKTFQHSIFSPEKSRFELI